MSNFEGISGKKETGNQYDAGKNGFNFMFTPPGMIAAALIFVFGIFFTITMSQLLPGDKIEVKDFGDADVSDSTGNVSIDTDKPFELTDEDDDEEGDSNEDDETDSVDDSKNEEESEPQEPPLAAPGSVAPQIITKYFPKYITKTEYIVEKEIVKEIEYITIDNTIPVFWFEDTSDSLEEGSVKEITFNISQALDTDITINYNSSLPSVYEVVESSDFSSGTLPSGSVVLLAGTTSTSIYIETADDLISESDEYFNIDISLSTADADLIVFRNESLLAKIEDSDMANPTNIILESITDVEFENGDLIFKVNLTSAVDYDIIINWSILGSGAFPVASSDFQNSEDAGQLIITAGSTSIGIVVPLSDDFVIEPTEDGTMNLSLDTYSGPAIISVNDLPVRIIDND